MSAAVMAMLRVPSGTQQLIGRDDGRPPPELDLEPILAAAPAVVDLRGAARPAPAPRSAQPA